MIQIDALKKLQFKYDAINPDKLPSQIKAQLEKLQLTQAEGAAALGINERTMRNYLQDTKTRRYTVIPFSTYALLMNMKR